MQVGDDGGMILPFLLDCLFCLSAPRCYLVWRLCWRVIWDCMQTVPGRVEFYTFMLVGIVVYTGIFLQIGWTTSRRCPMWFFFSLLSSYYPLFPPKKKSDAEKADIARAELEQFVAEHGQMPSQHSDLASSRSLSWKLKKLKLLHLLKHDWRRENCEDTLKFYDLHGRIPRRQNIQRDEQRAEDALARRWDRLLEQKAALAEDLLNAHNRIFLQLRKWKVMMLI